MNLTEKQKQFIRTHEDDDVRRLALKKSFFKDMDMAFILAQIAGRQIARHKIPSWYANDETVYPAHLSLEQASSEATAQYKASHVVEKNRQLVDLTGGLGVDFAFLSSCFQQAVYVENNEELCAIAAHNFRVLKLKNTTIKNEKAEVFLSQISNVDVIYLDPSRRDKAGQKVFFIEDCAPNVDQIKDQLLEKAAKVIIKYSPMLDISHALKTLKNVYEVHIISMENECKELLFVLQKGAAKPRSIAVNISKDGEVSRFSFLPQKESDVPVMYASKAEDYLYEPNASILKAGAFNSVAKKFQIKKLHKNTHLYTSSEFFADFPGRIFDIQDTFIPNKRNLKSFLSKTSKANLSVRNFPMSVAEIRKKTQLKEGGDVYLFATTLSGNQKMWVVCKRIKGTFQQLKI